MTVDSKLVELGIARIDWAGRSMPVLRGLQEEWTRSLPLAGLSVGACLHVTTETANLAILLKQSGAAVKVCASNPLSTQDDVSVALMEHYGIETRSRRGESTDQYYKNINSVLDGKPDVVMDDGADLISTLHTSRQELIGSVTAGTEETTTGVIRLRAMADQGKLRFPVIGVNEATTKHMFDNQYGTGQSSFDGIMRATNLMIAGLTVVICGYGWCGRGLATRARGLGARVVVVEVEPLRALEAVMDGYYVTDMEEAAAIGDLFVTATGNCNVIDVQHFRLMKDGAVLANSGHFNVEINLSGLDREAESRRQVRPDVEEFVLGDGRRLCVLGEGRLVNLACAEGHPAQVMDMSFANQALVLQWLVADRPELEQRVYAVPERIDRLVARRKLEAMNIKLQRMTDEQKKYLTSWEMGT